MSLTVQGLLTTYSNPNPKTFAFLWTFFSSSSRSKATWRARHLLEPIFFLLLLFSYLVCACSPATGATSLSLVHPSDATIDLYYLWKLLCRHFSCVMNRCINFSELRYHCLKAVKVQNYTKNMQLPLHIVYCYRSFKSQLKSNWFSYHREMDAAQWMPGV